MYEVFPGNKGGRRITLTTLPPSCAVVMKSGNLNYLDPSGLFQACNGTALLYFTESSYSAVSILRVPNVRGSVSSEQDAL
jgi:hypothetical protein